MLSQARHNSLAQLYKSIKACVLVFVWVTVNGPKGQASSVLEPQFESQQLQKCFNGGPPLPIATFEAYMLKGSEPNSLILHRVFSSSKTSSLPLTVLTGLTVARLDALRAQCVSWSGPLVAAVYVPLRMGDLTAPDTLLTTEATQHLQAAEHVVQAVFDSTEEAGFSGCSLRLLLLYELIGDPYIGALLPINGLRNAAMLAATTPLVAMVDVDLLVSTSLAQELREPARAAAMREACKLKHHVFILPAFETATALEMEDGSKLAVKASQGTKADLQPLISTQQLFAFALYAYARGHNATDYQRWETASEPYQVAYQPNYEPWFVVDRLACPPYDVRFRGYGWNKVAQVALVNGTGFKLFVLPSAFLVHRPHGRSDAQLLFSKAAHGGRGAQPSSTPKPAGAAGQTGGVGGKEPAMLAKLFHRKVAALRHVVVRGLLRGTYTPVVDQQSQRCREVLDWWGPASGSVAVG